mgnify:CR=1 FL=1|jgi:hypothetical protein
MTQIKLTVNEAKEVIDLIDNRCLPDAKERSLKLLKNLETQVYWVEEGGKPDEIPAEE